MVLFWSLVGVCFPAWTYFFKVIETHEPKHEQTSSSLFASLLAVNVGHLPWVIFVDPLPNILDTPGGDGGILGAG